LSSETSLTSISKEDLSKAHFRKSVGLYHLKEFDKALLEIEESLLLTSDPLLLKHKSLIKKEISDRDVKEKKMYQKMFE
jgi:hypothetical protein